MKTITGILFFASMGVGALSCNDEKTADADNKADSTTVVTTTDNTTMEKMSTPVEVPATTKASFETKYPAAKNVTWVKYTTPDTAVASKDDLDEMEDNKGLDSTDYQVSFDWNEVNYLTYYEPDGSWIKTTYKLVNHADLSAAVNDAINKQFPGYSIKNNIEVEEEKKGKVYEVFLEKGTELWKVHFDANGKVLKKKNKSGKG